MGGWVGGWVGARGKGAVFLFFYEVDRRGLTWFYGRTPIDLSSFHEKINPVNILLVPQHEVKW